MFTVSSIASEVNNSPKSGHLSFTSCDCSISLQIIEFLFQTKWNFFLDSKIQVQFLFLGHNVLNFNIPSNSQPLIHLKVVYFSKGQWTHKAS